MAYAVDIRKHYELLEAIHQLGSFAAAATLYCKVPSALDLYGEEARRRFRLLLLFDRSRQKAVLTPSGHFGIGTGTGDFRSGQYGLEVLLSSSEQDGRPKLRMQGLRFYWSRI